MILAAKVVMIGGYLDIMPHLLLVVFIFTALGRQHHKIYLLPTLPKQIG
jgi:hypothetical protein